MKKILVAVDFSENAFAVFQYATELANELKAEVFVLHVVSLPIVTDTGIISPSYSIPFHVAEERLDYFMDELAQKKEVSLPKVKMHRRVQSGNPSFNIPTYAKEIDADLIVMGTIDKQGIFARMMGSVTTSVINEASVPVLLIHRNTRYSKPEKIVFGIDNDSNIEDALEDFHDLNKHLTAYTEFIHIKDKEDESIEATKREIIEELVECNMANYSFEIKEVEGKKPSTDIIDYCLFSKADMLVMIHHDKNIFYRLFNGSVSYRAASKLHLPVLIIPQY